MQMLLSQAILPTQLCLPTKMVSETMILNLKAYLAIIIHTNH